MVSSRRLIMVHGYNHDPRIAKYDPNRPGGNFDVWPKIFPERACLGLSWHSGIMFRDGFRAWANGHFTTYAWAYSDLAVDAARRLHELARNLGPIDVVAHSLGTRVVLLAAARSPTMFGRVVMLNGAETVQAALPLLRAAVGVEFLNVAVREDDVLRRMGARFEPRFGRHGCIGNGIGTPPDNVTQVILDDPLDPMRLPFPDLRGDNPDSYGDHDYSWKHEGNYELYRTFLRGEL